MQDPNRLVGAYVCPEGVVSQVVYLDAKPDMEWFQARLENEVGRENVNPADIRIASRHGWELGGKAQETIEEKLGKGASIKEVYWTRYPKTEAQKLQAVSLCLGDDMEGGCMKLFLHDKGSDERLCPGCRGKYTHTYSGTL